MKRVFYFFVFIYSTINYSDNHAQVQQITPQHFLPDIYIRLTENNSLERTLNYYGGLNTSIKNNQFNIYGQSNMLFEEDPQNGSIILLFVPQYEAYYSEYIVMKEALEAQGYIVEVRSVIDRSLTDNDFEIYMDPYTDINQAAEELASATFNNQFEGRFGSAWDNTLNDIPTYGRVDGSILDITTMNDYAGLIVAGGLGALAYRVDGQYEAQGDISADLVEQAALKLNTLAISALQQGKPVMAQCHASSLPVYWRIPNTSGIDGSLPEEITLGYSLLKGGRATGFPDGNTAPYMEELDVDIAGDPGNNTTWERVTISSPHLSLLNAENGAFKIITTRDWYPQTVAHAAATFDNIIKQSVNTATLGQTRNILILHGGAVDVSNLPGSCSPANKTNDVPCNNGTDDANLPADFTHLVDLLEANSTNDPFTIQTTALNLANQTAFTPTDIANMKTYFEGFDAVIFFKHWSTHLTNQMQTALVQYVEEGGGVMSLHHGLYNDLDNGQDKSILINELFGAWSNWNGWGASLQNYDVYSTNHGHFISTYGIDYQEANTYPAAWGASPIDLSANHSYSQLPAFEVYDELYTNMAFTGDFAIGTAMNEINLLFSNNQANIAHTTGFTRLVQLNDAAPIGRVFYLQIGERKENYIPNSISGQIIRNGAIWTSGNSFKIAQTIDFELPVSKTYGDDDFNLSATSSSGLPVSLEINGDAVVSINGNVASIIGTGTATITATQSGNATFSAATPVEQEITVNKANLIISAVNQSITYGSPLPELQYTIQGLAYEETEAVFSSAVEISTDATLTSDAGEYQILVAGAAATNYNISFENALLTISKANQEINVEEIGDKIITDPPFEIMASTTSGLSLSYQINGPATLSGTTISLTGESGIVTVTVSQEGNINYEAAASVVVNITVSDPSKQSQSITFGELASRTFGDAPFELVATSDSGLPVSFESSNPSLLSITDNMANILGAGEVTITATQAGNEEYNPASPVEQVLIINKAIQIIEVESVSNKLTTDPPFDIIASTSSGLPLNFEISGPATFFGITISLTGEVGTVTLTISQEGDTNYEAASVEINFMVTEETRLSQIINFEILDSRTFGDAPFELVANSDSGLPVSFESLNSNILSIAGNLASIHGAGEVVIIARQEGNDEYMPADAVERILVINKATQEISFEEIPTQSFETGFVTPQANSSSGLPVTIEILEGPVEWLNNNLVFISAGFVKLVATQAGNENYLAANPVESEFQIELINGLFDINKEINIYPNPNNGIFEIKSLAESRRIIQIYDPIGIEVYRIETTEENVQVDITSLPIGAYFLKIFESNTQETIFLKIIKN